MNATQYRANLEKEKAKLQRMLESRETAMRGMVVRHLRRVLEELNTVESDDCWVEPSDTAARIVIADLARAHKVLR
jgi:hypothetical protein